MSDLLRSLAVFFFFKDLAPTLCIRGQGSILIRLLTNLVLLVLKLKIIKLIARYKPVWPITNLDGVWWVGP